MKQIEEALREYYCYCYDYTKEVENIQQIINNIKDSKEYIKLIKLCDCDWGEITINLDQNEYYGRLVFYIKLGLDLIKYIQSGKFAIYKADQKLYTQEELQYLYIIEDLVKNNKAVIVDEEYKQQQLEEQEKQIQIMSENNVKWYEQIALDYIKENGYVKVQ